MSDRAILRDAGVLAGAGLLAGLVAVVVIRPLAAVQIGFDTAASVIHFQRLIEGRQLEAFVTTTPKPLLTLADGVLHAIGGWTAVAWAAIGVHALASGLAALLALRVAGLAAAVFVAVAFAGNAFLLLEASFAYAVPCAVALWCIAALLLLPERPRYGLAGVALLLATLARFETLVLVALAATVLAVAWLMGTRRTSLGRARLPGRAWALVALPVLALPVMLVHDWLLTGDPMFWATVSARYTEAARARAAIAGPVGVASSLVGLVVGQGAVALLAVVGVVGLIVRRSWAVLVGLAGLGPGMIALLLLLAVRGTYVSERYSAPIELSILFAAGIGIGLMAETVLSRIVSRPPALLPRAVARAGVGVIGAAVAIVVSAPWGPFDRTTVGRIADERRLQANGVLATTVIDRALDRVPGSRDPAPGSAGVTSPSGRSPLLYVPGLQRPRLAIDLGLPLDRVFGIPLLRSQVDFDAVEPGGVVYHDRNGSGADSLPELERSAPFDVGGVVFEPLLADLDREMWIYVARSR